MNRRRLYRCSHDRVLAGVASGVAEYFDLDPSLVRIMWVISIFFGGLTFFLYIAMALIVPVEPDFVPAPGPWQPGSDAWASAASAPTAASTAAGTSAATGDTSATGERAATGQGAEAPGASAAGQPLTTSWHSHPSYRTEPRRGSRYGSAWFFGIILILFGALALADQYLPAWADHGRFLWPAFILGIGILLVVTSIRRHQGDGSQTEA